jgi:DNA repair protein RecN (Recombination protein N)
MGLAKLPTFSDTTLDELVRRLASVRIELQDISSVAEDGVEVEYSSPEELQRKSDLLDAYNSALRKHGLFSQEDLIQLQAKLEESLSHLEHADADVAQHEEEVMALENSFVRFSSELSQFRTENVTKIEADICSYLTEVKLADATIRFDLFEVPPSKTGTDGINMLFSANKGMAPQPIEKSASGGELSRLMLVLQHLLSKKQQLPTVIFDEIDSGVSGEVAQRIGALLQNMGANMQLLAITHLPQVAGKGKDHLKVIKRSTDSGKTITELIYLTGEERVEEVARLMSGTQINDAALENAKNLMNE